MQRFRIGRQTVDLDAGTVGDPAAAVRLTSTERRLLGYLAVRSGEVVERQELLTEVWGYRSGVETRAIDQTVARLRGKLGDDGAKLRAVYGQGLRLDAVEPLDDGRAANRLFGRSDDLVHLAEQLRTERLVTLVGPGGSGKSRLVAELAPRLVRFELLQLSVGATRDAADLDSQLLRALGGSGSGSVRMLVGRLLGARARPLLVLDECEPARAVVAACAARWLAEAPGLKILATSRVPLDLPGEQIVPVGALSADAAADLFVDRVRQRAPDLPLPRPAVLRVVDRLDHLPLAIELAAAHAALLGLDQLAHQPLDGLRTDVVSVTVDRSVTLLSPGARRTLLTCGTFEEDFDAADVTGVTGLSPDEANAHLDEILAANLATRPGDRDALRLYHLVRKWARDALPPDDPAWDQHARWFARLGDPEHLDQLRVEPDLPLRFDRAAADLRAAFARLTDPELRGRCGLGLLWWSATGPAEPAFAVADQLEGLPVSGRVRAGIAVRVGSACLTASDPHRGVRVAEEGLAAATHPSDRIALRAVLASHLRWLGRVEESDAAIEAGEADLAGAGAAQCLWWLVRGIYARPEVREQRLDEAERACRAHGDRSLLARCLLQLAQSHEGRGRFALARDVLAEAETEAIAARAFGATLAHLAYVQGMLALATGDLEAAESRLHEAYTRARDLAAVENIAVSLLALARVALARGDLAHAEAMTESASLDAESVDVRALIAIMHAEIALARGEIESCRRLAAATRADLGSGWPEVESELLDLEGVATGSPELLDRAAALDRSVVHGVRRAAMRAWVLASAGRTEEARSDLSRAEARASELGLGPQSEAATWIGRATRALAAC